MISARLDPAMSPFKEALVGPRIAIVFWAAIGHINGMDATLPLDQMSVEEKLRAIETLWEDLRIGPEDIPVPEWHRQALRESEERVQKGEEKVLDWEEAKALLRKRFE